MCYSGSCKYEVKSGPERGLCSIMPYPNAPADADCAELTYPEEPFVDAPLEEPFSMRGFANSLLAGQHG